MAWDLAVSPVVSGSWSVSGKDRLAQLPVVVRPKFLDFIKTTPNKYKIWKRLARDKAP